MARSAEMLLRGVKRLAPGQVEQPFEQRDRERGGREGDNDASDHQGLRYWIGLKACSGAASGNRAKDEEDARPEDVEADNATQKVSMGDHHEETNADEGRATQAEQRRRAEDCGGHRPGAVFARPATSRPSVAATDRVRDASMITISGFAMLTG